MRKYIRNYVPGGTYFFTQVTEKRIPYLGSEENSYALFEVIKKVQISMPFELLAYCFLPDHIHLLIKLPDQDSDFSYRTREVKRLFTVFLRKKANDLNLKIWQDRFWEHTIRDEKDMKIHFDYIHYNPVKHGLSDSFDGWKWSSFRGYYDSCCYEENSIDLKEFVTSKIKFGE